MQTQTAQERKLENNINAIDSLATNSMPSGRSEFLEAHRSRARLDDAISSAQRKLLVALLAGASSFFSAGNALAGRPETGCGKDRSCTHESSAREAARENACHESRSGGRDFGSSERASAGERNRAENKEQKTDKKTNLDRLKSFAAKQATKQAAKKAAEAVVKGAGRHVGIVFDLLDPNTNVVGPKEEQRQLDEHRKQQERQQQEKEQQQKQKNKDRRIGQAKEPHKQSKHRSTPARDR